MTTRMIINWLLGDTLNLTRAEDLICKLADKLQSLVKLSRISLDIHTVHPEVFVQNIIWKNNGGINATLLTHEQIKSQLFIESPVAKIYNGSDTIRIKTDSESPYPLAKELAEQGCTDYIIFPMEYTRGGRSYISYTTVQKGGFTDSEIDVLEQIRPALSRRLEIEFCHFSTRSLLQIYLGELAASRVLHGKFKRGTGESIETAIWLCDLRNYTGMTMSYEERRVTKALDKFFELVADTISRYDGDILKFMGDSMLVIFDDPDKKVACQKALEASLVMLNKLRTEDSGNGIKAGIAIHVGSVVFGNVGGTGRLDFTIIGKEVNYASRLEPYCKLLKVPLILSAEFVQTAELKEQAKFLGKYELKGFPKVASLYTVPHDAAFLKKICA